MNAEQLRHIALGMDDVEECQPFGEAAIVYKVAAKIYMILGIDDVPVSITLKCNPARSLELRAAHQYIVPGYHMNKRHWNTIYMEPGADGGLIRELISHSYSLVAPKKPK